MFLAEHYLMGLPLKRLRSVETCVPQPLRVYRYTFPTPIGEFLLLIDDDGAVRLSNWTDCEKQAVIRLRRAYEPRDIVIEESQLTQAGHVDGNSNSNNCAFEDPRSYAVRQLQLYFNYLPSFGNVEQSGDGCGAAVSVSTRQADLQSFLGSVTVRCPPSTQFTRRVWAALCSVSAGEFTTYGALAELSGRPNASRAVGRAVGANQLCVLLPCHRVVGASRALVGFGPGISRKVWLLRHEQVSFLEGQSQCVGALGKRKSRKRFRA